MFADLLLDFEVHEVQYMFIDTFSAAAPPFTIFALIALSWQNPLIDLCLLAVSYWGCMLSKRARAAGSLCAYVIETFFKMMLLWWCFCVRVGNNNTLNLNYIYNSGRFVFALCKQELELRTDLRMYVWIFVHILHFFMFAVLCGWIK